jgi:hypothetical protein
MKNWIMMNTIKKLLGFVWMLMSPAIILFLVYQAYVKIGAASEAAQANTILQWVIILLGNISTKKAAMGPYTIVT